MERDHDTPHGTGFELCPQCSRPFVVPTALLDFVDDGLYLLALECVNCGRLAVGLHDDEELEAMEWAFDRGRREIEEMLELLGVARFIDDLGSIHQALDHDALLPEDF